jgi:hypothetical protein
MKHYILLSVAIPPQDTHIELHKAWLNLLYEYPTHKPAVAGSERLSENVWLFERDSCASAFAHLVAAAESVGLLCRIQFLTSDDA